MPWRFFVVIGIATLLFTACGTSTFGNAGDDDASSTDASISDAAGNDAQPDVQVIASDGSTGDAASPDAGEPQGSPCVNVASCPSPNECISYTCPAGYCVGSESGAMTCLVTGTCLPDGGCHQ
jgi:hypothetical protein